MKKKDSKNLPARRDFQEKFQRDLYDALLQLKTPDEYKKFLDDLCTPAELQALTDRWRVAQHLFEKIPYRTIYETTGVSTATITRVARSLEYGSGYRLVLEKTRRKA